MLFFDGSARNKKAGAGVVLIDPHGDQVKYMVHLDFERPPTTWQSMRP
jgi:hypothetical protein